MIAVFLTIFSHILTLLPYLYISMISTGILVCLLYALSVNMWVNEKRFRILSLFYNLQPIGCMLLAASWCRLVMAVIVICRFQVLNIYDYLLFLIPGFISIFRSDRFYKSFFALLWLVIQLVSLIGINLICGYMKEYGGGPIFKALYVFLALLIILFSIYLFLLDISSISEGRKISISGSVKEFSSDSTETA